MDVKFGLSP